MTRILNTTTTRPSLSADAASSEEFALIVPNHRKEPVRITAQVTVWGDDVFVTSAGATVCDSYTADQKATIDRLANEEPVRDGDIIAVNGNQYRVKAVGVFSDPAKLIAV